MEVGTDDIVRVLLQFLRESGLHSTHATLTKETGVHENLLQSKSELKENILKGQWMSVLQKLASSSLPEETMWLLYEEVFISLISSGDVSAAKSLLINCEDLLELKLNNGERFDKLQEMTYNKHSRYLDYYRNSDSTERRKLLSDRICSCFIETKSSKLLELLGYAISWQKSQGMLHDKDPLFGDTRKEPTIDLQEIADQQFSNQLYARIKLGKASPATVVRFSPDGRTIATGTSDGFIELWHSSTGKLRKDLSYQAEDHIMSHKSSVLDISFDYKGTSIASGSTDGILKVWSVATGKSVIRVKQAHQGKPVSCVGFLEWESSLEIVSGGHDGTIRFYGAVSGAVLHQLNGHNGQIVSMSIGGQYIVTAGTDDLVKVWSHETKQPLFSHMCANAINNVELFRNAYVSICDRSNRCSILNLETLQLEEQACDSDTRFMDSSHNDSLIGCLGEDGNLYSFNFTSDGAFENPGSVLLSPGINCVGLSISKNIIAAYSSDGIVTLYR